METKKGRSILYSMELLCIYYKWKNQSHEIRNFDINGKELKIVAPLVKIPSNLSLAPGETENLMGQIICRLPHTLECVLLQ